MNSSAPLSGKAAVLRLLTICPDFSKGVATEKLALLRLLADREIRAVYLLKKLHSSLCYLRAFPDNRAIHAGACAMLERFGDRVRKLGKPAQPLLYDSGIAATWVHYGFAYASMSWLIDQYAGYLDIDWEAYESAQELDQLLQLLISPAEQAIFDDQVLHTRDFMRLARGTAHVSELAWLFRQSRRWRAAEKLFEYLYDQTGTQIIWSLEDCRGSRTHARLPQAQIHYRRRGMRKPATRAALDIIKPMPVRQLGKNAAARLLDVVNAALLVRCREVYHMQYASAEAVYLGSCGAGIQIAFMGAKAERRFSLEAGFGYMVFANGVPIAYGGLSPLFNQGNTGLNVLDEYRRGESAYIYTQVLRMGHSLFGMHRFVVNPYQFGQDNREALHSGAFWFYYRLGFRPVARDIAVLADQEYARLGRRRSSPPTLQRLASCDLQLQLPGAGSRPLFPEHWLGILATGAARLIAAQSQSHHHLAIADIVRDLRDKLGIRDLRSWTRQQRRQLQQLAPVFGLIDDLDDWSRPEKRALTELIRARGATSERHYARLMGRHRRLYKSLRRYCLREQRREA